jgi:uncharacterized repeat protein (TIGR01451 family)
VNVDRRWWETSVVRGRVLAAVVVLLGAGCAVLGLGSHLRSVSVKAASAPSVEAAESTPGFLAQGAASPEGKPAPQQAHALLAGLPLIFEPNQGQGNLDPADTRARFVARGAGYSLFLGSQGAILSTVSRDTRRKGAPSQLMIHSLEMKLAGANGNPTLSGAEPLPGKSNYLLGNDPSKWRSGVPEFARVRYEKVYPGIDLVFYGNQGRLEYDFQVAPGADPSQAEIEFNGARQLAVEDGALLIKGEGQSVRLEAPRVYQEIAGQKQAVQGSFVLRGANRAGFSIGAYDRSRELIIDPILNFSTYFGGSGDEHSTFVAVDGSLNIYITGSTTSPNLPTGTTVLQPALAGAQNVYVAKITPPLSSIPASLAYVTYLGGSGTDSPVGIGVDAAGDAYVAGTTSSPNFPITPSTAYQRTPEAGSVGTTHVFVTKLNPTATALSYSTYLSGNNTDTASGMTIDALGFVYVTGTTMSTDTASASDQFPASTYPEQFAYQNLSRSSIQFFVTKINTQAQGVSSIPYSTYFGGADSQTTPPVAIGGGIAVDLTGIVYFSGTTNFTYAGCSGCGTTDFPILNAYQPCLDAPPATIVVGNPPCTGTAPTTAPDAFVAKLNPLGGQGQQLVWSTYLGGSANDFSTGVGLDTGAANVYVVGTTNSADFVAKASLPTFASYQACLNNNPLTIPGATTNNCSTTVDPTAPSDAFVARLTNPTNATGIPVNVALNYFSYLGGANDESGRAITVDTAAGALITGWTQSPFTNAAGTFPLAPNPNPIQGSLNGPQDAFVARINTGAAVGQTTIASWANYFGGTGTDAGTGIALDLNQDTYLAGETNSTDLQVIKPLSGGATNNGGYDAFVTQLGTRVSLSISGVLSLGSNQTYISAGNPATFTYTITNNGPDLASNFTVTDNINPAITGVPLSFQSASTSSGTCPTTVTTSTSVSCSIQQLNSGATVTVTFVLVPSSNSSGSQATFNGGTVQVTGAGNVVYAQTSVPAQMSDFTMTVGPSSQTVPFAGGSVSYYVQLTPHPLYTNNISLSCTNLPIASTCAWAPSNSVPLQGASGATVTLTITTTARPNPTPAFLLFPRLFLGLGLMLPGLAFVFGGTRRRKIAGMMMFCSVLGMLMFMPSCGTVGVPTPVSGTPPGNSQITVTATSGSDSKSGLINLVVP